MTGKRFFYPRPALGFRIAFHSSPAGAPWVLVPSFTSFRQCAARFAVPANVSASDARTPDNAFTGYPRHEKHPAAMRPVKATVSASVFLPMEA